MRPFIALLVLFWTSGCVTTPSGSPTDLYFESRDYVIYQLRPEDTAASLAGRFLGDPRKAWQIEDANGRIPLYSGQPLIIPLRPTNIGGLLPDGFQQIPILCYHRFGNDCESPLCVPTDVFAEQMNYLKTNGYRVISAEDLLAFLEYRHPLPGKAVMITVDDGYQSFYTVAYPILKNHDFTATLFVYTNFVGVSSKALSWDQLRELKAAGFTIGSHTIAHSDLTAQGEKETRSAYLERLRRETSDSKSIIDRQLDQDTFIFAYPFGRVNPTTISMVQQAGYKMAVTVDRGSNPFFHHPFALRRDQILKRDMATFISGLQTFEPLSLR